MKRLLSLLLIVCMAALLIGCSASGATMEFGSELEDDDRVYYTGQEFDAYVKNADGAMIPKIPHVYIVYADGTRSEDVSHSENIVFSGYDLTKTGQQGVTVTYTENGRKITGRYLISVEQTVIERMTASDTTHFGRGSFNVGESFTTYTETEPGVGRGVSVTFTYNDPSKADDVYYANAPELDGIVFDTSECALDQSGRFTKAGEFTVYVKFKNFETSYKITVTDAKG